MESTEREAVSSEEAVRRIRGGARQPLRIDGVLDLRGLDIDQLPTGISCGDLDASSSSLRALPDDIEIDNRLVLDDCILFEQLPEGLTVGSLRAREALSLAGLPERLDTWFLDLAGSTRFHQWPAEATVHRGRVSLRGCLAVQSLPNWFSRLACLDLSGCFDLRFIPDGFTVSQWIDVGGTRITSLPGSLQGCRIRWRGVSVSPRLAFEPETITGSEVLGEPNAEVRRVMMERMGYRRFAEQVGAVVVDTDSDPGGRRQLLRVDLDGDEPLVGLSCSCPSTGQQYLLRVPPSVTSCHQAAAWLAGFDDPSLYHPTIET